MRRVATTATLDMHPRDVDSVWRKADDTGDREGEEAASKQRSCWGIACPSSSWPGLKVSIHIVAWPRARPMLFVLHLNSRGGSW